MGDQVTQLLSAPATVSVIASLKSYSFIHSIIQWYFVCDYIVIAMKIFIEMLWKL